MIVIGFFLLGTAIVGSYMAWGIWNAVSTKATNEQDEAIWP